MLNKESKEKIDRMLNELVKDDDYEITSSPPPKKIYNKGMPLLPPLIQMSKNGRVLNVTTPVKNNNNTRTYVIQSTPTTTTTTTTTTTITKTNNKATPHRTQPTLEEDTFEQDLALAIQNSLMTNPITRTKLLDDFRNEITSRVRCNKVLMTDGIIDDVFRCFIIELSVEEIINLYCSSKAIGMKIDKVLKALPWRSCYFAYPSTFLRFCQARPNVSILIDSIRTFVAHIRVGCDNLHTDIEHYKKEELLWYDRYLWGNMTLIEFQVRNIRDMLHIAPNLVNDERIFKVKFYYCNKECEASRCFHYFHFLEKFSDTGLFSFYENQSAWDDKKRLNNQLLFDLHAEEELDYALC